MAQSYNPKINKQPPDPRALMLGQTIRTGRKSTLNERSAKSLEDQNACTVETAEEWVIPTQECDWLPEQAGYGGDLWWDGYQGNGLEERGKTKTRPVLTQMMQGVIAGTTKCIIVWNLNRLWRNVSICQAILDILFRHECLLFDYNGPVNIWTYEGRNSVLQAAIRAQEQREDVAVSSPRGIIATRKKGGMVVSPNVLGFRSAGKRTGEVRHLCGEQELVNRIYRMFDAGEGDGPMSTQGIAEKLMAEGMAFYAETGGKNPHGKKRAEGNEGRIYVDQVRDVLTDCRYIGKQQHNGETYPCPAFLRDVERDGAIVKETVVPVEIWERVQAKIDANRRVRNRSLNFRPLASLVRCGLDGEALTAQENKVRGERIGYWIMRHTKTGYCCHKVPTIREEALQAYVEETLAPLLMAEINEQSISAAGTPRNHRVQLERELRDAQRLHVEKLPAFALSGEVSPFLLGQMERQALGEIARLRRELAGLAVAEHGLEKSVHALADLKNASPSAIRDALRQCLCWVAVLSTPSEREPKPQYRMSGYSYAPSIVGKLVFLTSWGTYHTAVIHRERMTGRGGYYPLRLRPATPDEIVGGVADFPEPERFVCGLTRAWAGKVFRWSPQKFAPGYFPDEATQIAAFNIGGDDAERQS